MHKNTRSAETVVYRELPPADAVPQPGSLARAQQRGALRIGYDPNNLPMSFFNADGDLVGFEVELAEQLADALELRAEFVPIIWPDLPRLLAEGVIDIMPGVWYRPYWFSSLELTDPYFTVTIGVAVRDERRHEFDSLDNIRKQRGLKIGVPLDTTQIARSLEHYFGGTDAEFVTIEFWNPFFEGKYPEVDAFLMPAEHASGWTLLHPEFTVVVPQPDPVKVPTAFGVALGSDDLVRVINEWIVYAENAGLADQSYAYWITGQGAKTKEPRWSILHNVLKFGE
jgi:ABC-type amino acid transport substrate-binding protein